MPDALTHVPHGIQPNSLEEGLAFAKVLAQSELVPTAYRNKPENIFVAVQMGAEIGLSPMQSIQSVAVINGRPALWGDAMIALVLSSPRCEYVDEGESTLEQGVCVVKRKGDKAPYRVVYTRADAKKAGLLGKAGPWTQYEARMLRLRARGFALRDKFADVLRGLISVEEQRDIASAVVDLTPVERLKATLEPPPAPAPSPVRQVTAEVPVPTPPPTPPFADDEPDTETYDKARGRMNFVDVIAAMNHREIVQQLLTDWRLPGLGQVPPGRRGEFIELVKLTAKKRPPAS